MDRDHVNVLFCPPMPPLRLGESDIAIGRHPDCEFNLRKDDVSRRHAEVCYASGGYVLRDLGSTNGSYVNGVRVEGERALLAGDRIEIGKSTIMFCEVDGAGSGRSQGSDARTVIFDRAEAAEERSHFSGDLAEIPGAALFQLMEMNRNTGRLEIQGLNGVATVWFAEGHPVHATSEKNEGFDAAITVVGLQSGSFKFMTGSDEIEHTIQASVTEVLLEACRLEDEQARLS